VIGRNEIIRLADRDDVPAQTVERDYVLAHVLSGIASHEAADQMVFKGGTALRLCYIQDFRYSADLDFSLVDGLKCPRAVGVVAEVLESVREATGFPTLAITEALGGDTENESPDVTPGRIYYVGPLGASPRSIKLDLADDELVVETHSAEVIVRYSDQPAGVRKRVYTLAEVAAEKLRCILQRVQCRDLLDLWELFEQHGQDPDEIWPEFERKSRHRGFDPAGFPERFDERMAVYRRRWEGDLDGLVIGDVPPFNEVDREVRRHLRDRLRR
jgi:predicted nucleotidyltransferase component of viral defense system